MTNPISASLIIRAVVVFALAPMAVGPVLRAESAETIPNLTGAWARTTFALEQPVSGPGPLRNPGNVYKGPPAYASPNLKPEAARIVRERFESTRAGKPFPTPSSTCWPMVAPLIFRVQGMQLLQQKDQVTIIYMQDHEVRRVRLNSRHPEKITPSWHGNSIGHYEGDTLVIDTIGVKVGTRRPRRPGRHAVQRSAACHRALPPDLIRRGKGSTRAQRGGERPAGDQSGRLDRSRL